MNPVYSPVQPGAPYGNPKNMAYTGSHVYAWASLNHNPTTYSSLEAEITGYPTAYPAAAPAYNPSLYPTNSPSYAPGYTAGTPYKVPPTQSNTAPPPYSPSPNPYQTAMYPIRSAYPQQNLYAQGAYYTQPVYAAQPHVIHHTTVVQPNSIPSAIYPAPVAAPRTNGVAMGMVAGTTMAMSAGTLLTTPQHTAIGAHPVSMPTYRAQGTPAYSYVPPHW
ncbi:PREDICTED: protein FAM168A isoform X3 [Dipodomys ordii]|uniref:Protein FAM168A isoform X3 n=1 Tax=Dipodomys ordii TaxID=10020 RepID=A0A1S3EYR7_DIPOR|nr:PREDICTED: protein FAM168A isoform X3 [Dipodomys ordii]